VPTEIVEFSPMLLMFSLGEYINVGTVKLGPTPTIPPPIEWLNEVWAFNNKLKEMRIAKSVIFFIILYVLIFDGKDKIFY
jgi:hypothetical protein